MLRPIKMSTGGLAEGIVVSPDGRMVYRATLWPDHVSIVTPLNTASDTAAKAIPIRTPIAV